MWSMEEPLVDTSGSVLQAVIHFESIHAGEKRVPRLDSLVEQATAPFRPDGSQGLSAADREELSSIYLEVRSSAYFLALVVT